MPYKKKKLVPINYTSRDFERIKRDLVEHAKRYYPDTYKDFNEASFGSMMIDTVAYVGDMLSFYLDYQANESFLDTAMEYRNVVKLSKQMGYNYKGNTATASGVVTLYIKIPALSSGIGPNRDYIPTLKKGTKFSSRNGAAYTLTEDVDFSHPRNELIVASVNNSTGVPTQYAIRAFGQVVSGELAIQSVSVGAFTKFMRIPLNGQGITEIVSVTNEAGQEWFEVDNLSQNIIYKSITNRGEDRDKVPTILKPVPVPRRFTTEYANGITYLQFGYGSEDTLTNESITDPSKVILQQHGKDYTSDKSFDPSKLIETDKFGVPPSNTTLTVFYRVQGGGNINVAAGGIGNVSDTRMKFFNSSNLVSSKMDDVYRSLEVTNEGPIHGDVTAPTSEEIKQRAYGAFYSQNRAVTKEDYTSLLYNMPPRFGAIKRANIYRDTDSNKRNLNLYIISEDEFGNLADASMTLKRNVKTWISRYKMLNDTIDILDAKIVNIGIRYNVVADMETNKYDLLERANDALKNYFATVHYDIGEPFRITDVWRVLKNITGLLDVKDVTVFKKEGQQYASSRFNIKDNLSPDGTLLRVPENVVLEIKYPNSDVIGSIS